MWNWQHAEWPHFTYEVAIMHRAETLFAEGTGRLIGVSKHLGGGAQTALRVELLSGEAVDSSAIEGERLDRDSVQSSIQRQLGLATDARRPNASEAGMARMMVDLFVAMESPLSHDMLFDWHSQVVNGRNDLADVGRYRRGDDPMQIVSGPLSAPKVHFEAPPAARIADDMAVLIDSFNAAPRDPGVIRAGLFHLWFESIHPFEDGNGRIGRALIEKALGMPSGGILGMAPTLLRHRRDYYQALERASRTMDITDWLLWFAAKAIEAQRRTLSLIDFTLQKSRLLNAVRTQINFRQEKVLLRMLAEGPEGFRGGLSAANYQTIADTTSATATRDLADLVEMGALNRTGQRKSTRYYLPFEIEPVSDVSVESLR